MTTKTKAPKQPTGYRQRAASPRAHARGMIQRQGKDSALRIATVFYHSTPTKRWHDVKYWQEVMTHIQAAK